MAEALNYCQRTINSAKAELKAKGLLSWQCRGGHHTPLYELAWEVLKAIASSIKAKVRTAFTARKIPHPRAARQFTEIPEAAPSKPVPAVRLGKQFSPSYLIQQFKFSTGKGFWKAPGTPPNQVLSDQQLDAKAHSRLWAALQRLDPQHLTQIIEKLTDATEAEAVKAERYKSGTGLAVLSSLIGRGAVA